MANTSEPFEGWVIALVSSNQSRLGRNIELYPYFRITADGLAWLPVFFLFFSQYLTLAEVVALEAVYYLAVVVAEVPSGYFSDRFGRRRTLLLSSAALILSYLFFLSGATFWVFAMGQVLLAASLAFRSGSDTSLLYESLTALDRAREYGDREAKAGQYGFIATAVAALAGGLAASVNLSWAYWISLVTAFAMLFVVQQFSEPGAHSNNHSPHSGPGDMHEPGAASFVKQLHACLTYLRTPLLAILFFYYVYLYVLVHIPYEFYQPYLALLDGDDRLAGFSAPVTAGVLFASTALVGALASRYSMVLVRRLGLAGLLGSAALLELLIIAGMALWLHPVLALLIVLRSGPMAVVTAPLQSTIAPLIKDAHRATFLSIRSLAGRLAFSILLTGFALLIPHGSAIEWGALSLVLRVGMAIGIVGIVVLWLFNRRVPLPTAE